MNAMCLSARQICLAAVPLVFLTYLSPLVADESPTDKAQQQDLQATTADVDSDHGTVLRLVTTRVNAIQLASHNDQLGADVSQVDEVLRSHVGDGLVVTSVADDGPAAKAGIQKNDVLVSVGEEAIAGLDAFRKTLDASPHASLAIGLIRGGKKLSVMLTPRSAEVKEPVVLEAQPQKYWLGVGLAAADETLRSQLSLPAGEGLVVTSVENDSPAAQAGAMVNDILLQLDDKALSTIEALSEQLQSMGDKSVSLKLLRRGKPAVLTVTPALHSQVVATSPYGSLSFDRLVIDPNAQYHLSVAPYAATPLWTQSLNGVWLQPNWTLNTTGPWGLHDPLLQIRRIEEHVKELEASLAALRTALEAQPQPAVDGAEKK